MDVSGIGAGLSGADPMRTLQTQPAPARELSGSVSQTAGRLLGDAFTSLLPGLSEAEFAALLQVFEQIDRVPDPVRVEQLFTAAKTAAAQGDAEVEIAHLSKMAPLDPNRVPSLPDHPDLLPVRAEVARLVNDLTLTARLDAEGRLAEASKALEGREAGKALVTASGRLYDAGGYVNWIRSSALSQLVLDQTRWAPAPVPTAGIASKLRGASRASSMPEDSPSALRLFRTAILRGRASTQRLWRRAPLLVLLLAWLAIGIGFGLATALWREVTPAAASSTGIAAGFEVWALGFLALVLYGFYRRVRNVRF